MGTPQNLVQSYTWFAVAAGQGDEDAGKKRDEVGQRLSAADLASAKAAAESWRAQTPNQAANEPPVSTLAWSEPAPAPTAMPKRAASAAGRV
jgi:localization factor PodJL